MNDQPNERPTPETDANACDVDTYAGEYLTVANRAGQFVESSFARRIERDLAEAREQLAEAREDALAHAELLTAKDRQLAAERALADRLAEALGDLRDDYQTARGYVAIDTALAAHRAARGAHQESYTDEVANRLDLDSGRVLRGFIDACAKQTIDAIGQEKVDEIYARMRERGKIPPRKDDNAARGAQNANVEATGGLKKDHE